MKVIEKNNGVIRIVANGGTVLEAHLSRFATLKNLGDAIRILDKNEADYIFRPSVFESYSIDGSVTPFANKTAQEWMTVLTTQIFEGEQPPTQSTDLTAIESKLDTLVARIEQLIEHFDQKPVQDSITVLTTDGNTPTNTKGYSLIFQGSGGTLGGEIMPNGYVYTPSSSLNNEVLGGVPYTIPTIADGSGFMRIILITIQ